MIDTNMVFVEHLHKKIDFSKCLEVLNLRLTDCVIVINNDIVNEYNNDIQL
jgi:hypothetical protein